MPFISFGFAFRFANYVVCISLTLKYDQLTSGFTGTRDSSQVRPSTRSNIDHLSLSESFKFD